MESNYFCRSNRITILYTRGGDTFIRYKTYELLPGLKKYLDLKLSLVNQPSYVIPVLKPSQLEFQKTSEIISQNIFQEHTARHYLQGVSQKIASVSLVSAKEVVKIGPQIGILGIIGYSSLALGIGGVGIYCGLNLLRERVRNLFRTAKLILFLKRRMSSIL